MRRMGLGMGAGLIACLLGMLSAQQAAGRSTPISLDCGDTIGPGGSWTITDDIGPCETSGPAITIVGPVRVDLSGHTIDCGHSFSLDEPLGLDITGRGVRVSNGTIHQCGRGVRVGGEGRHRVRDMTIGHLGGLAYEVLSDRNLVADGIWTRNAEQIGILVSGHKNRILRNSMGYVEGFGVQVTGDSNRIAGNTVSAERAGVEILGDDNRVYRNTAVGSRGAGIRIFGDENRVRSNDATGENSASGIRVDGALNSVIGNHCWSDQGSAMYVGGEGNRARRNTADGGVFVWGNDNTLEGNVADGNGNWDSAIYSVHGTGHLLRRNISANGRSDADAGFAVFGSSNTLIHNQVLDRHLNGFWVQEGAMRNLLRRNDSTFGDLDEDLGMLFDLRDDNPACGTNQWIDNSYATVNQSCTEGTLD